ncbi:hypothetical protein L5515_006787 [Caenorhabditis briggsae]|uniref:Receptor L-domain domain-containing protein n=1 Tax=Caenorhabditis briggsae TaxID=6238 RepID=A0AAE9F199_CAEBR|nr:hypothetical protein L5515_006787 [Caenorhabditis briggsae]
MGFLVFIDLYIFMVQCTLINADFSQDLQRIVDFYEADGFFIENNSYLYDATMLLNMDLQSEKLDMDELCNNGNLLDLVGIRTGGNFRNCAKLCEEDGDIEEKVLCHFKSMYDLPNNCDIIVGNVTIGRGDEQYVIKFVDVQYLFGSFIVVNTTLETLEYVGFPYIAVLDSSSPVYQIIGNKKLKNADISITQIITSGPRYAIYQDNNPKLFKGKECQISDWWSGNANKRDLMMLDLNFTGADCDGVIIQNNKNLSNAGALEKLVPFVDEDLNDCKFQIANNPILDLQNLCDGYTLAYLVNFETYGNLKNCGCQGNAIYPPTLFGFQNCTYFYNGLRLYNFSDTPDLKSLSNIVTIYGNIDIQNSNFQNLSFLESFQLLTVYTKNEEMVFNIQNCPNMTRLELPALKNLDNSISNAPKIANFQNLHPDFCLTISDFWLFYELGTIFTRSFKDRNAVIQDNHPDIWNSTNGECNLFGLVTDEKAMYRTSLNYTGGDCGTRIDNGSTLRNMISGSILVIVFSLTHELHL